MKMKLTVKEVTTTDAKNITTTDRTIDVDLEMDDVITPDVVGSIARIVELESSSVGSTTVETKPRTQPTDIRLINYNNRDSFKIALTKDLINNRDNYIHEGTLTDEIINEIAESSVDWLSCALGQLTSEVHNLIHRNFKDDGYEDEDVDVIATAILNTAYMSDLI